MKNNTDLKGAIITSNPLAETLNKNSLSTGTLTYTDIHNQTEYDAKGLGVSGGVNVKGGWDGSGKNKEGRPSNSVNKSVGFGLDSDKDSSVTKSGVNTQNITITESIAQQALTGKTIAQSKADIYTTTSTENAKENSGAIANNFDKDKVQKEIGTQIAVTKRFDENRQAAKQEINTLSDTAKEQYEKGYITEAQYQAKRENYKNLGLLIDTVASGLSAPTSSGLGIATATLSPAASYKIGQYFKEQASKNANGQLTSGQEAAHILAHTVLGGAVAAAGGNNALTAGLSAGGAEAAAPVLSSFLYGKEAKDLTAEQKSTISSIVGLAATALGATTGDVATTVQSGQVAQNAVENNDFSIINKGIEKAIAENKKEKELNDRILANCKNQSCIIPVPEKTMSDNIVNLVNNLTLRQFVAVIGLQYDPVTGEEITPKERQIAKASALALGFSKSVSGVTKLSDDVLVAIEKKYGNDVTKVLMEPEADFAGRIVIRPRAGITPSGTAQIDTPLGKHLINGEVAGRKNQKVISGGHNSDNFYEVLNISGGKVIGNPTQVSKGIMDIKYQLPNGRVETKTVYDPKVYTDKQMAVMANEAASKAIVNYGVDGNKIQHVIVNGITFRVPISSYKGTNYVPSAFPINPISKGTK
ncbi:VENN motif pre-toxin domain-containing protein [Acinetobacter soli]|nr:VENN motif pre-toxin domain-containing protein [Acinetobacter soli]MDS7694834.1 VENN motif pre-toxin domain-containing protein [Acinetobacter soli]